MIRSFTRGLGIFHIQSLPIFHLYAELTNIERKLHWNEDEDTKREVKWHQREGKSIKKLNKLLNNEIGGVFGLGANKSLKDYEYLSGVDLVNKTIEVEEKAFTAKFISSLPWDESPF